MIPFRRPFAIVLALSAILLRAFLPIGWMPSTDARAPLIICPMMGGTMPPAPAHQGPPQHHDRFCPFTASLAQLAAITGPPVAPPAVLSIAESVLGQDGSQFVPTIHRSQSPRAPPLIG